MDFVIADRRFSPKFKRAPLLFPGLTKIPPKKGKTPKSDNHENHLKTKSRRPYRYRYRSLQQKRSGDTAAGKENSDISCSLVAFLPLNDFQSFGLAKKCFRNIFVYKVLELEKK